MFSPELIIAVLSDLCVSAGLSSSPAVLPFGIKLRISFRSFRLPFLEDFDLVFCHSMEKGQLFPPLSSNQLPHSGLPYLSTSVFNGMPDPTHYCQDLIPPHSDILPISESVFPKRKAYCLHQPLYKPLAVHSFERLFHARDESQ